MYKDKLAPALRRAYPSKRSFFILEDNDPSGFKAKKGEAAKAEGKIQTIDFPKRSPDLNPLDYGFWSELNKRMRRQERSWPMSKTESRKDGILG